MATVTVTPGYNWVSGEVVTPAKMNLAAAPTATVSAIVAADIASDAITTVKILDANVTTAKLATVTAQSLLPAGAVMAFARATAPAGWLIANGDAVPNGSGTVQGVTANFAALYAAVSTSFGTVGTLPDLRGIFVRGSGSQTISGTAYTKAFALKEVDDIKAHQHSFTDATWEAPGGVQPIFGPNSGVRVTSSLTTTGGPTGGETRPANIALLYCIKF
jgi:microcystin-dependent protein